MSLLRCGIVAVLIFALDRLTKLWVVEWMDLQNLGIIDVYPPFLTFRMAWNRGINFGLFDMGDGSGQWILTGIALAISAGLLIWATFARGRLTPLAIGAVVGGALGNAWDRVTYGAVADFLNMTCCGINNPFAFNVADAAIFVGAVVLVVVTGDKKA